MISAGSEEQNVKDIIEKLHEKIEKGGGRIKCSLTEDEFLRYANFIRKHKNYLAMHSAEPFGYGGYAEYKKNDKIFTICDEDFDAEEFDRVCERKDITEIEIELDGETYYIFFSR